MKLNKKGKIIMGITLIVIALALSTVYILKSGSERFAILNIESVENVNDPALKIAVEATEECNKIEKKYRDSCYRGLAWWLGSYNEPQICEKLKEELKSSCYGGYGWMLGEEYNPDIKPIQDYCSKTNYFEACLGEAAIGIGKESSKHIETEQCKRLEQYNVKQKCYDGVGRQLAKDNRESKLCEKTEDKKSCLIGFAYKTDTKNRRAEALQICQDLNDAKCYFYIGINNYFVYNKSVKESFKNCEQYPYPENCKQGAAIGVAIKFFEENQQKNEETASVTTPVTFVVYKPIKLTTTKISLIIKQQIIPHFVNYKLTYLTIFLSSLELAIVIQVLKNKSVQKTVKKALEESYDKIIKLNKQRVSFNTTPAFMLIALLILFIEWALISTKYKIIP